MAIDKECLISPFVTGNYNWTKYCSLTKCLLYCCNSSHADGMIRSLNKETVLVNYLSREQPAYQEAFKKSLRCKKV